VSLELLRRFEDYLLIERNRSVHTARAYLKDASEYLDYLEKNALSLGDVETTDLRSFFAELTGASIQDGKKRSRLDARSQRRKLAGIRALYSMLVFKGELKDNPALVMKLPRFKRRLPGVIPYSETRRLLEEIPQREGELGRERQLRDRAIVEMLYASGMRISELLSLDVVSPADDLSSLKVLGKGRRERYVVLGPPAERALRAYLEVRHRFRPRSERLFLNQRGEALSDRGVRKNLLLMSRDAGIARRIHPHKFRHSMATDLLNEGADIRIVQELLGHRSLASTQVYTAVTKDRLKDVYRQAHPHGRIDRELPEWNSEPGP
jgi:integrase/recombinase XerC